MIVVISSPQTLDKNYYHFRMGYKRHIFLKTGGRGDAMVTGNAFRNGDVTRKLNIKIYNIML